MSVLSLPVDLASNAVEILNILVSYLFHNHGDCAIDIGLTGIPLPETKSPPELYFFDVVGQTNAIVHLVDKQFKCQAIVVASFAKLLAGQKDENWLLPVMFTVCLELRRFAAKVTSRLV